MPRPLKKSICRVFPEKILKRRFNILIISVFLLLVLSSCPLGGVRVTGNFWAYIFKTNRDYRVDAELLALGLYCNVWVEKGCGIGVFEAQLVANEYDNYIHNQLIEYLSIKNFEFNGQNFSDIMKLADYFGNGDGKLCILLLDIKDNHDPIHNRSYVAGYFWSRDFYNTMYSNKRDMIYIDVNPGMIDADLTKEALRTLAHETQHLMNFVTSQVVRRNINSYSAMDTWIDEGLASAAEYLYEGHSRSRMEWYNNNGRSNDVKGLIDKGNNFFVWGNRNSESIYANLDDYSTVYLFFQWLRTQAGSSEIYKDIITSPRFDYCAVVEAIQEYDFLTLDDSNSNNWDTVIKTWLAANHINAETGPYGYMNDDNLKKVKAPFVPEGITSLSLVSGEGVYSVIPSDYTMPASVGNIKYVSLGDDSVYEIAVEGDTLLTYNKNSVRSVNGETGITTGIPPPEPPSVLPDAAINARSVSSGHFGPYRIDANDFLRQRFYETEGYLLND